MVLTVFISSVDECNDDLRALNNKTYNYFLESPGIGEKPIGESRHVDVTSCGSSERRDYGQPIVNLIILKSQTSSSTGKNFKWIRRVFSKYPKQIRQNDK